MRRRELLGIAGAASAWLAGCLGDNGVGADATDTSATSTETATRTPTATDRPTSTTETETTTTAETETITTAETTPATRSPTATNTATATRTATPMPDPTTETDASRSRSNSPTSDGGVPDGRVAVVNRTLAVENGTADGSEAPGGAAGTDDTGGDEASVRFDAAANRVVVTGTIVGENGCQSAALESVSYDADAGLLTVTIGTERDAPADAMCSMALVEITYEATIAFEGGLPERVSVVHRGVEADGEVATATRDS